MEGPRGATPEDIASLKELVGLVFRPSLYDEYPQLFHEANLSNCRIILKDGRVVSHVGMTIQGATILGCQVKAACIGAVSTHPDYRGRGYATRLFADAGKRAWEQGVDFMIVSGDRRLYRMAGCRRVGLDFDAAIPKAQAQQLAERSLSVEKADRDAIPVIASLYALEPVRFLRTRDDYERAFECAFVMNRASDFLLIRRGADVCAYAIVQRPSEPGTTGHLAEIAGDRTAILGASAAIMELYDLRGVHFHVGGWDRLTQQLCQRHQIPLEATHASGTVRLIHFEQLMARMLPLLSQTLGVQRAGALQFEGHDQRGYTIRRGQDVIHFPDRGSAVHALFGTREEDGRAAFSEENPLARDLREALPFPALWYGINYV